MTKRLSKTKYRIYYTVEKLGKVCMDLEATTQEKAVKKLHSFYVKNAIKEIRSIETLRS